MDDLSLSLTEANISGLEQLNAILQSAEVVEIANELEKEACQKPKKNTILDSLLDQPIDDKPIKSEIGGLSDNSNDSSDSDESASNNDEGSASDSNGSFGDCDTKKLFGDIGYKTKSEIAVNNSDLKRPKDEDEILPQDAALSNVKKKRRVQSKVKKEKEEKKKKKRKAAGLRRNIKKILKDSELDEETIAARKAEEERMARQRERTREILQQQQLKSQQFDRSNFINGSLEQSDSHFDYDGFSLPNFDTFDMFEKR